ncbi:MAG TPA: helix-hairpin-helix domain-containing protein [Ktedonobacterales bacterium]|jgi:Pathogenicity locus|nr:helix-hairpin-helix domain-containing protein [Ktedonobacterales bacterium]
MAISAQPSVSTQQDSLRDFQRIPGIGPSMADDLWRLGYRSIAELRDEEPETMYERLCELSGGHVDRCVLYVFRCAVYFASTEAHDPELLKWWNWSDQRMAGRDQIKP